MALEPSFIFSEEFMIPLPHYAKIKNRYCILYLGNANEYILQLKYLRHSFKLEFPDIEIYIACKDSVKHLVQGEKDIILESELKLKEKDMAYVRTITCDMKSHPIENLAEESQVKIVPYTTQKVEINRTFFIATNGVLPTKNMTTKQYYMVKNMAQSDGYEQVDNLQSAGWVIGVENENLFLAAESGLRTTLIPMGFGTKFYQKLFPEGEILPLPA